MTAEIIGTVAAVFILTSAVLTGFLFRFMPMFHLFSALKITAGIEDEKPKSGFLSPGKAFAAAGLSLWFLQTFAGLLSAILIAGVSVLPWIFLSSFLTIPLWYFTGLASAALRTGHHFLQTAAAILGLIELQVTGLVLPFVFLFFLWNLLFPGISGVPAASAVLLLTAFLVSGGIRRIGFFSGHWFTPLVTVTVFALFLFHAYSPENPAAISSPLVHGETDFFRTAAATGIFLALTFPGSMHITSVLHKISVRHPARIGLVSALIPALTSAAALAWYPFASDAAARLGSSSESVMYFYTFSAEAVLLMTAAGFSAAVGLSVRILSGAKYFRDLVSGKQEGFFYLIWFLSAFLLVYFLSKRSSGQSSFFPGESFIITVAGYSALFSFLSGLIKVLSAASAFASVRKMHDHYFSMQKGKHRASGLIQDLTLIMMVLLPQGMISRIFGYVSLVHFPAFIMQPVIRAFASFYQINVSEAEKDLKDYKSLNKFFTRKLRSGSRPVSQGKDDVVSPVDGRISVFGTITEGRMIQAKHIDYSMEDLLDRPEISVRFMDGFYVVIYLSPQDYHRIHSPREGEITGYSYIPGKLFSVNRLAVDGVYGLFPKNERLATYIRTDKGLIAVIKVGAVNVGKISISYRKFSTNSWIRIRKTEIFEQPVPVKRGEEIGRFEMGSTVILLFEKGMFRPDPQLKEGKKVRLGELIGHVM